ncbi:exodeoxyribonuclease V subunit alpha [Clostridium sp. E02]|nr:exodeoxyribonuclease V subunit alpha [Clostridium sp. E02]
MKEKFVKSLQKTLERVSLNSVGKSIPVTMYERKIPDAVIRKSRLKNEHK